MGLVDLIAYLQQGELFPNLGVITEEEFDKLVERVFDDTED